MSSKRVLLIPSASYLPSEMQAQYGKIPTSLYPYQNTAVIEHICEKYRNIVDSIYVAGYYGIDDLKKYISYRSLPITVIELDKFLDLGYTIYYSLASILNELGHVSQIYINFGDTLTKTSLKSFSDSACYDESRVDVAWTFFKQNNGVITNIFDKVNCKNQLLFGKMFVGEFSLSDAALFVQLLLKELSSENTVAVDTFYRALEIYSRQHPLTFQKVSGWVDVGHISTSLKARIGVEARDFNTIEIDENRGILKKTSTNKEKFIDEISWYLQVPEKLQYIAPRIYEYSLSPSEPFVSMEYYGYNTLHESYLYGKLPINVWRQIFEKLAFILSDMHQYQCSDISSMDIATNIRKMYVDKILSRLSQIEHNPHFSDFFTNEIQINDISYPSLNTLIEMLPETVESHLLSLSPSDYTIIHGDFCFTNILVETNYNFIRLIDPRGSFGMTGIYGDSRYDMAKLLHSIDGYDYMVGDLMHVKRNGTNLKVTLPETSPSILAQFNDVFKEKLQDRNDLRLIESTLFLSMLPMHSNSLERQYAMLATGVRLFHEAVMQ